MCVGGNVNICFLGVGHGKKKKKKKLTDDALKKFTFVHKEVEIRVFTAVLFVIVKTENSLKCNENSHIYLLSGILSCS